MNYKKLLAAFLFVVTTATSFGQILIPNSTPLTQNFDGMGTSGLATIPTNWKMSPAGTAAPTWAAAGNLTAVSQGASTGTPTTGGRYNWGNGTTTSDRALGFMTSGGYVTPNSIMAFYQNTSGATINNLAVSFDYERYRININACAVTFFTSTDGSTWTARTAGDSGAFSTGANAYDFTTGTVVSKSFVLTGLGIANGGNLYLRWNFDNTGSASAQGVGLDNVSVAIACTAPVTQASTITFGSVTTSGMAINWTNGTGAGRVVKMNTSNTFTAPTDGAALPAASTAWANAGEQVVFAGTGSGPVTITGLNPATTYWYRVYEYCTNGNTYQTATATLNPNSQITNSSAPTATLANNGTQIAAGNVPQGTTNHILSSFQVTVANATTTLTSASFLAQGTYLAADINGAGFKLWYNTTNNFATASALGTPLSSTSGGGDVLIFSGLSQALAVGTSYFWVTANIATSATPARTINLDVINNADLTFSLGTKSGSASVAGTQTITPLTKTTIANGDWADPAIWSPVGVPLSSQTVLVNHIVTSVAAITRDAGTSTTISAAASLAVSATYTNNGTTTVNGTFQLNGGGYADGTTNFVYGANGTLVFNATYTANGGTYWPAASGPFNVTVTSAGVLTIGFTRTVGGVFQTANGVSFPGFNLTLNGTCQVNGGGYFNNTPIYGNASTLIYNNGGPFSVTAEWTGNSTTAGAGVPQNVTVQNSSTISMPNSNRGMAGNLNISSGNLTLNATSGDLYLAGNWTRASSASFTPNGRAVFFNGSTTQTVTVSATGTETFNYLLVSGSGTLRLATGTNVVVNSSSGLTLSSSNATSTIDLNGQTLTLSGGGNLNLSGGTRRITSTIASGSLSVTSNQVTITNGGSLSTDTNTIVKLQNGLDSGATSLLTINGTLQINSLGFCVGNSPRYGATSLLQYNTTGTFLRTLEWTSNTAAIGTAGYPNNVQISNNTTLSYYNATNTGPKGMNGNFVIDAGSSITFGAITTAGALSVAGNVTNAGTITLGVAVGDDLKLAGNYANTGTGTFNGNDRAMWFTKAGTQTVATGSTPLTIPYVVTSGGGTTVQLLCNVSITATLAGNAIDFGNAADVIDMNGFAVSIGTASVANVINGSGSFKGNIASNLTLLGTGSLGTLKFSTDFNLATFTVNRTAATVACVMGSAVTVNTALVLTNGLIDLVGNTMTLAAAVNPTGSANSYVIADVAAGGVLSKAITGVGSNSFPIGDRTASTDGSQYSPVTINFTGGAFTSAFLGLAVNDIKHPNMDATSDYLSRYWAVTTSGTFTTPAYSFTGTYSSTPTSATDIFGATGTNGFRSAQWDGSSWFNIGGLLGATLTLNCTTLPATNHFSAGARDREINIVQGATNYLTGSIYNFGNVTVGFPLDITFAIQNLGFQSLALNPAAPTITGGPSYSLFTSYLPTTSINGMTTTTPNSLSFVIRFSPAATGTFTGSITIRSNDADEGTGYVINFTGVGIAPTPEINVKGIIASNPDIVSGDTTPNPLDNTQFAATNIGSTQTKTFRIENGNLITPATAALNVTSITSSNTTDFTVNASAPYSIPYSGTTYIDFTITFNPQSVGLRTSTISIVNDDTTGGENPYTFAIEGNGVCLATSNTATPASGPVGTEVTITAVTNNIAGASLTLNGVSQTVTQVSSTVIKFTVQSGAVSGNLVTTNSQGCTAATAFTVIKSINTSCQGGNAASDLFISEVTDATLGGTSYVEIYNGTPNPINMSNYALRTHSNASATPSATLNLNNFVLNSGSMFIVALGIASVPDNTNTCTGVSNSNGELANQTSLVGGINFTPSSNDYIALYNTSTATTVDAFGVYLSTTWADALGLGDRGAVFRRKNTATLPSTTFNSADWNITNWAGTGFGSCGTNDYSDIGLYTFTPAPAPLVTIHPSYTATCKSTKLTVAGSEGYTGVGNTQTLFYQWYSVAPNTANWTSLADGGLYSGALTATLTISDISTLIGYQFYCQIRESSATCYTATNAVLITVGSSTTWQVGNTWSNLLPTINKVVIIDTNYDTATYPSFDACNLTINNGATVTIRGTNYVNIDNNLTVNTGGSLIVENNGSLVMIDDTGVVTNNGTTQIKRTASNVRGFDYVYWSSPVVSQSIDTFYSSPTPGYKYKWNPLANNINSPTSSGTWQLMSGNMTPGAGYIVRGSSSYGMAASSIPGIFGGSTTSGAVNNGVITPTILRGSYQGANYTGPSGATVSKFEDNWNLVGNPYPSSIKALDFLTANTNIQGFVYLWTHGTAPISTTNPFYNSFAYNYTSNDYIAYNGTATTSGPAGFGGYIGAGQGFFVVMNDGPGAPDPTATQTVRFKNSMRSKTYSNSQFYKTSQASTSTGDEKHRIWLDLVDSNNQPVRTVIGYVPEATEGLDRLYDAYKNIENEVNIYSLADNQTLIIQGRPLPFDVNDQVPIGVRIMQGGAYKIAIGAVDGLFDGDGQSIYLEDKLLGIVHDLRTSPYSFNGTAGITNDRFVLRYTNAALGTPNFEDLNSSVVVATNHGQMTIKSYIENIQDVIVYDILGRQLLEAKNVNNTNFMTSKISLSQQALIVKIKLNNGVVVTRKIVL